MKENFASINVIIDGSGSMLPLVDDTIGGCNSFLEDQKKVEGEAAFTLVTFNTQATTIHDFVPLDKVPQLTREDYRPHSGTALLDAVGFNIDKLGKKLAGMPEEDRPSKVIFLIITDGQENSSVSYTKAKVAQMIKHQREVYNWEFVFMGANIDAVSEGSSLGVSTMNSVNYDATKGGTKKLYTDISQSMGTYRASKEKQVDFFNQKNNVKRP